MHTKQTELAKTGRWSLKGPKPGKEAFFHFPNFHITFNTASSVLR